ncbi:Cyclin-dependent protein kinase inhibitor SMR4 [Linum grandiflorum]
MKVIKETSEVAEQEEQECTTPRSSEFRIPAVMQCPPPPKKKRPFFEVIKRDDYFRSLDIDALFLNPSKPNNN